MTNFKKLVGWDADFYKSLPQDECLICLSKRELYVIGEALRQVSWSTRWHGDMNGLDLDDISANIELKIQGAIMCNCQFITDCIDDATNGANDNLLMALEKAVQYFSQTSIDSNDTTIFGDRYDIGSQPISDISLDDGQGGCDLDKLWGAVYGVVSRLAQLGLDLLEVYTSRADAIQKTSELIKAIPFVGSIAGSALSLAADIAQDIENAYNAYQTQAVIDQVACDIFCEVQHLCRVPTFDEILEYYATGRGYDLATVTTMSYATLFNQALGNLITGGLVWHGVQLFALGTMYLDGEVLGRTGTSWIDIWAYEGEKSPSNLHLTLCDCPVISCWRIYTDTPSGLGGIDNGDGTFTSQFCNCGDVGTQQRINIETIGISQVEFTGTGTPNPSPSLVRIYSGNQPFSGSQLFSGSWASFVANSPITGGNMIISGNLEYTVELSISGEKCS